MNSKQEQAAVKVLKFTDLTKLEMIEAYKVFTLEHIRQHGYGLIDPEDPWRISETLIALAMIFCGVAITNAEGDRIAAEIVAAVKAGGSRLS